MEIVLNGETSTVPDETCVGTLVENLGLAAETVVVQRNDDIVPREHFAETRLEEGDVVEIVRLVGGG